MQSSITLFPAIRGDFEAPKAIVKTEVDGTCILRLESLQAVFAVEYHSLDKIEDLGYEIIKQIRTLKAGEPIDFGESLEANIGTLNEHAERISETQLGHLVDEARRTRLEREAEQAI